MSKTRKYKNKNKNKNSILKSFTSSSKKVLPVINNSLNKVGHLSKRIAYNSIPIIQNGVSHIYNTMYSGLNLGIKSIKTTSKKVNKKKKGKTRRIH